MKSYQKETKTLKGINGYLGTIGLGEFAVDEEYFAYSKEFDFDGWVNEEETKGVSVQIYKNLDGFELFASKYTNQDIES